MIAQIAWLYAAMASPGSSMGATQATSVGADSPRIPVNVYLLASPDAPETPHPASAYVVEPGPATGSPSRCLAGPLPLRFMVDKRPVTGVLVAAVGTTARTPLTLHLFIAVPAKPPATLCIPDELTDEHGQRVQVTAIDASTAETEPPRSGALLNGLLLGRPRGISSLDPFSPDSASYVNFSVSSMPSGATVKVNGVATTTTVYEFSAPPRYLREIAVSFKSATIPLSQCARTRGRYDTTIYLVCTDPTRR